LVYEGLHALVGGGNSNIFHVHPYLGKISNFTTIFSDGLKPPTSSSMWFIIKNEPKI